MANQIFVTVYGVDKVGIVAVTSCMFLLTVPSSFVRVLFEFPSGSVRVLFEFSS